MLLALRGAADAPSHQCHNRIRFGSSRPSERHTTSAREIHAAIPAIFSARGILTAGITLARGF
jgi:hypothetical protein